MPNLKNETTRLLCSDESCDSDNPKVLPQYDFRMYDSNMASESQLSLQF